MNIGVVWFDLKETALNFNLLIVHDFGWLALLIKYFFKTDKTLFVHTSSTFWLTLFP